MSFRNLNNSSLKKLIYSRKNHLSVDNYTKDTPKLLMHFDGSNGSTTFTDSSVNNFTITGYGSAKISTTQSKFGGASLSLVDSNASYLTGPANCVDWGTGNGTVELWAYVTTSNTYPCLVGNGTGSWTTNGITFCFNRNDAAGRVTIHWNGHGDPFLSSTHTFSTNTWYHVAFVRDSPTSVKLYVDGVLEASGSISASDTINFSYNGLCIGRSGWDGTNGWFPGYIDELRISNKAIYTSAFTPPTTTFKTIVYT